MAFSKVILNGVTLMDVTQDTVTAETLKQNETAHGADGMGIVGAMSSVRPFIEPNDVTFYDYDGTVVASYTASDFAQLEALPANPSREKLVAQGWNWTLTDAKTHVAKYGKLNIGQMYVTQSGNTEIDVEFIDSARLNPTMTIAASGTITVDWGDNTTPDTVTGSSLSTRLFVQHTYANIGKYTISIHAEEGRYYSLYSNENYLLLTKSSGSSANGGRVYAGFIKKVRIGNGITSLANSFYRCYNLVSVSIPSHITTFNNNSFYQCYNLRYVTFPSGIQSTGNTVFSACAKLKAVSLPKSITEIGQSAFAYCYNLSTITIPDNVSAIYVSAFRGCTGLEYVNLPDSIPTINDNTFNECYILTKLTFPANITALGNTSLSNCFNLASLTIPENVTSIGTDALKNLYGIKELHMKPSSPPTLANEITGLQSDAVIYVPQGSLSTYKTTTNWSSLASQMQEEQEE